MRILSLGAGVQSTAVFLMAHEAEIEPIDHAIFADTQEEPAALYQHLEWLRRIVTGAGPVSLIAASAVEMRRAITHLRNALVEESSDLEWSGAIRDLLADAQHVANKLDEYARRIS